MRRGCPRGFGRLHGPMDEINAERHLDGPAYSYRRSGLVKPQLPLQRRRVQVVVTPLNKDCVERLKVASRSELETGNGETSRDEIAAATLTLNGETRSPVLVERGHEDDAVDQDRPPLPWRRH